MATLTRLPALRDYTKSEVGNQWAEIGVRVQGSGGGGARVQITGHRVQFRARQKRLTSYGVPVALLLPRLLIRINASPNTSTVPSALVSP